MRLGADRALALWTGYAATDWAQPMPFERYCASLEGWEVLPVERGGQCIGAAFFMDGEVHVSVLPEYRKRWATRSFLRDLFRRAAQDGQVKTRISAGHEHMVGVMERLGFVMQQDGYMVLEMKDGH